MYVFTLREEAPVSLLQTSGKGTLSSEWDASTFACWHYVWGRKCPFHALCALNITYHLLINMSLKFTWTNYGTIQSENILFIPGLSLAAFGWVLKAALSIVVVYLVTCILRRCTLFYCTGVFPCLISHWNLFVLLKSCQNFTHLSLQHTVQHTFRNRELLPGSMLSVSGADLSIKIMLPHSGRFLLSPP